MLSGTLLWPFPFDGFGVADRGALVVVDIRAFSFWRNSNFLASIEGI